MGASHALGYTKIPGFTVAGFVVAKNVDRAKKLAADLKLSIPIYTDYYKAMAEVKPDVVSINTLADTHAAYSIHAMRQGCHIFMEKPIAKTVAEAEEVARVAAETKRKLVIGYILRVHPAWKKFIELAQTLGKPLIMRMNLNQQSYGHEWEVHKSFIANMSPLVDCGVHYVDVMCQMTRSKPKIVQGMAARVSDEIAPDEENYGALQVVFEDKSVGWYEVGWGPMMSKVAFFVKDVIGPKGCVSIDKDTAVWTPPTFPSTRRWIPSSCIQAPWMRRAARRRRTRWSASPTSLTTTSCAAASRSTCTARSRRTSTSPTTWPTP